MFGFIHTAKVFFRKKDPGGKSERPVSVPFYYILLLKPLINDGIGPRFDVNKYRNEGDFFEVNIGVCQKHRAERKSEIPKRTTNSLFVLSFCLGFFFPIVRHFRSRGGLSFCWHLRAESSYFPWNPRLKSGKFFEIRYLSTFLLYNLVL